MRRTSRVKAVLRVGAGLCLAGAVACTRSAPGGARSDGGDAAASAGSDSSATGLDAGLWLRDSGAPARMSRPPARDSSTQTSDSGEALQSAEESEADAGTPPPDAGAHMQADAPALPAEAALVIFDSDMSSDWDDVGDIAVLHGLASLGEIEIVAMAVSSLNGATALCMDAINTYYGKPDIPIGVRPDVGGVGGYPAQIASEFPHGPEQAPEDFPLAVDVYRRVLAAQPDKSVTIVTTGFLTNLKALLLSGPDQYSPLSGRDLVAQKVKLLSCAGGSFPSGDEFNLRSSGDDSAYVVLNDWPARVMYVGFNIGQVIQTAGRLPDAPADNPIRRVYVDIKRHVPYPAWGQVALYYAARASEGFWGAVTAGHNQVEENGHNAWLATPDPSGNREQGYLLEKVRSPVRDALDALIMLAPNDGTTSSPGDPSNLRATVAGPKRVDLEWTDNAFNETGFVIERGVNGAYAPIGEVAANITHFSDTEISAPANVSYRVKAINDAGASVYSTVWVYSGWTEVNFTTPGDLPLYSYYQSCNLRWSRGGDFRPDHVALNDDSQHGQSVKLRVDVAALGAEGQFHVYFFYQDPDNWYRLTADSSKSVFEKSVGGVITQIGSEGAGVNIGNGTPPAQWLIEVTAAGALNFSADGSSVLEAAEPLVFSGGKIGLGGVARTPVWENFRFETAP